MNTPVNFRAFLIISLAVTAAVFCSYAYMFDHVLGISLGCVLLCGIVCSLVVFILRFRRKKVKLRVILAFALALVASTSAFSVACLTVDEWNEIQNNTGYQAVTGRVCSIDLRSGKYRLDLDELVLGGKSVSGIMRVSFDSKVANSAEFMSVGDTISFGANVNCYKLNDNGRVNGTAYRADVKYYTTLTNDNIAVKFGQAKPLERLLTALHGLYTDNMGEKYGNIAFSMLTGDKHSLDSDITDYFSAAGLGHIMAVSGLHIGFLILILELLLCKLNKKYRLPIIGVFLIGYAVLADFSPSVVRAVIMAFVSGAAFSVGGRRDLFSSLLCAFSVILAVKPLYLFEAGFLLSFGSLLGIAMFVNMIGRLLRSHGAHAKVSSAIGASISVSVGILPAEAYFFGRIQLLALLVNMILLPYVSAVFISIVIFTPIAAIPNCGVVLQVCKYMLVPLDYITYALANVPNAVVSLSSSAAAFICYPVLFCASDFFMIRKGKAITVIYALAVCVAILGLCAI